jgi:hypothetical protein
MVFPAAELNSVEMSGAGNYWRFTPEEQPIIEQQQQKVAGIIGAEDKGKSRLPHYPAKPQVI